MKFNSCYLLLLIGLYNWSCQPEPQDPAHLGLAPSILPDTQHLRELQSLDKRLTVEAAFLNLPDQAILLEGLRGLSKIERKLLLKMERDHSYTATVVGNYLSIQEIPSNSDDEHELLEQLKIGVYNSLTQSPIVFLTQSIQEEQRAKKQIVQQRFFTYQKGQWEILQAELPQITTQSFFEQDEEQALSTAASHFYFDLQPTDVNYLQARLQHHYYPNKDKVALREAYRVALVWTGSAFRLNRQPMLQYEISEHHSKQ